MLYTGVTSNLKQRLWQHQNKIYPNSFTAKYNIQILVYFEVFDSIVTAISREKEIKGWSRKKKEALVEKGNPSWRQLIV